MSEHGTASNVLGSFIEFGCAILRKGLSPTTEESSILKYVTKFSTKAHQRFVMEDHLESANIGWTGDNFKKVMLKKIEENIKAGEIRIHQLTEASFDPEIMVDLGKKHRITSLAHFIEIVEKQSKGQAGLLLTNGMANVAYIIGTDGNVWAVYAHWSGFCRYWFVEAFSPGFPGGWGVGGRFLSRK